MPKKYIYPQTLSDKLGYLFKWWTEKWLNEIDGEIGDLSSLTTTAKTNLVAAINEAAASGGGSEEDFEQVYTTTLAEAAGDITISSSDMGGSYVDVVVFVEKPVEAAGEINGVGVSFLVGDSPSAWMDISSSEVADIYKGTFSVMSKAGLSYASHMQSAISNDTETIDSASGFFPFSMEDGNCINYPSETCPGITSLYMYANSGNSLPAGTTIIVYARRKVTAAE